ncbi:MAG: lysine 5,6-aminomutase subunit alpha [Bacillus subtilis]|nr:lysine 5,6-aminomutase subunit alpha [Bacillus subtilis]
MTGQSIHLLGMMTEAIHTPFLSDRHLAIKNAKMVQTAMASIHDEIRFQSRRRSDAKRAKDVLDERQRACLPRFDRGRTLFRFARTRRLRRHQTSLRNGGKGRLRRLCESRRLLQRRA